MAIQQIQYDDKEAINIDSAVPDKNKCKADDLNEIKSVVNNNSYETPKVSSQVDTDYKVNVITTKNLFDINGLVKGRLDNGVLGYASDTSVLTLNENSFSFTTTANYRGATSDYIKVSEGNYVFNSNTANSTYGFNCACYDSNKSFINNANVSVESGGTKRTFTITSGITYVRFYFYLSNAGTLTIDKPMLEQGSTATTYEAFIPNTINVNNEKYTDTINVGATINDKNRVNVLYSHNLFNKDNINKLNAYFESSGGTIIENAYNRVLYIPCNPNTDYTFTQGTSSLSNHIFQVATTNTKPEINTIVYDFTDKTNYSTFTYTTNATAKYLVIRIRGGDDVDTFYNGVQIEKGSIATAYEPFIQNTINVNNEKYTDTINVGTSINDKNRVNVLYSKNLFDKNNIEAGYLSNAGNVISNANFSTSNFIELNGATKITIDNSTGQNENICFYNSSKTFISYQATGTNTTMTIDVPNGAEYVRATIGNANLNIYIIQEGSTITIPSINIDGEEIYKYNPIRTIWTGANHAYNDVLNLTEQLEIGALYLVEMMAFSSSYRYYQEFMYLGYADILQINYSSFPDDMYVRYRIEATGSNSLRIKDVKGTAGTNTDITHIYRIK